ncbi:MAG: hypothetical protein HWD61_09590 [Parachlamydiaceae bacterium]|nr:MAG: hypothetical protein HWD61_09590 [Parachlamydiaceae bacterium]
MEWIKQPLMPRENLKIVQVKNPDTGKTRNMWQAYPETEEELQTRKLIQGILLELNEARNQQDNHTIAGLLQAFYTELIKEFPELSSNRPDPTVCLASLVKLFDLPYEFINSRSMDYFLERLKIVNEHQYLVDPQGFTFSKKIHSSHPKFWALNFKISRLSTWIPMVSTISRNFLKFQKDKKQITVLTE